MTTNLLNRRMALAFGIAIAGLQAGRAFLWWRWPQPLEWPFFLDAYLVGGLLLAGVALDARKAPAGKLMLAGGWGFACGILFRSFFEQLNDPSRHSGHEVLVLAVKGVLLAWAVAGFVVAVRSAREAEVDRE